MEYICNCCMCLFIKIKKLLSCNIIALYDMHSDNILTTYNSLGYPDIIVLLGSSIVSIIQHLQRG